jgi:iron only hydrogenase large subunit-like protein
MTDDVAKCSRRGREIAIADNELAEWAVPENDSWCCEACLTATEEQAIADDAIETVETAVRVRCGARVDDAKTGGGDRPMDR